LFFEKVKRERENFLSLAKQAHKERETTHIIVNAIGLLLE
jgi:hypothetical protein